jgi:digeranylgeranylglycerophospholipid reductase
MQSFDVVVVGGGPSGGQCSRVLAKAGWKVLLIERHKDFCINNFSSAVTPLETLENFRLPQDVIGSYWSKFIIVTSNEYGVWESKLPQGVVLDFGRLRQFLANDTRANGGEVWMNCRYLNHIASDDRTVVTVVHSGQVITINTKVLVDATGQSRTVIYGKDDLKPEFLSGAGIEYLVEVSDKDYSSYKDAVTFCLGYKWMPKGYSWVFPMGDNRLKIGAGIYHLDHVFVKETQPLRNYIKVLLDDYIKTKNYKILETHGSVIKYSSGLKDIYFRDNTIAIGDAVSTLNFLGGEGIRHAMQGSDIACKYIQRYLDGSLKDFHDYQVEMRDIFLNTWNVSEKLAIRRYSIDCDEILDKMVKYLRPMSLEDVVDILFFYRFEKVSKGLPQYLLRKLDSLVTRTWSRVKRLIALGQSKVDTP